EHFSLKNTKMDYRSSKWKPCQFEYNNQYYLQNKKYEVKRYIANTSERKKMIRDELPTIIINYNRCPEKHAATLQFHHKNTNEKEFAVGEAICLGYSIKRIKTEIEKCEILCANCHFKEHYIGG